MALWSKAKRTQACEEDEDEDEDDDDVISADY